MRKFLTDVRAEIALLLADNNTAQITPERLRNVVLDVLDSASPAVGGFASGTLVAMAVTNIFAIPPCPSPVFSSNIQPYVFVDPLPRTLDVQPGGVGFALLIQVTCTVVAPAGRKIELYAFQAGVQTIYGADTVGLGGTDRSTMSFTVVVPHAALGALDVRMRSTNGNASVDVVNSSVLVTLLPTETAM